MTLIELLTTNTIALVGACSLLGLLVGSFLNVVVYRLPVMMQREWRSQCRELLEPEGIEVPFDGPAATYTAFNLLQPASHCPACNHRIRAWENIPLLSFLCLGGKCSGCRTPISLRYPGVELVSAILAGLVAYTFGPALLTLALLLFTWSLIVLTLIDYDHQLLPDDITLPLLWAGLLVNTLDLGFGVTVGDAVIGAMAGYAVLWCFYWTFRLLTGKEGMGYGDFKLLAALGAWMGWQSLLPIIILSSLVGAVFGILSVAVLKRDKSSPIPFGPFLAGAGFIMLVWGPQLTGYYVESYIL